MAISALTPTFALTYSADPAFQEDPMEDNWFGNQSDQSALAPDLVAASQVYRWEVALRQIVSGIDQGTLGNGVGEGRADGPDVGLPQDRSPGKETRWVLHHFFQVLWRHAHLYRRLLNHLSAESRMLKAFPEAGGEGIATGLRSPADGNDGHSSAS